jgi:hypothetical protein
MASLFATTAAVTTPREACMRRPPRPSARRQPSLGWTVRQRQYQGDQREGRIPSLPLTPERLGFESDPDLKEQLTQLYELELQNLRQGADLRREAYGIARRPEIRLRLEQSDELVDTLPGHMRLRPKRRRGIFRHLLNEPDLAGLPLFMPAVPPKPKGAEWDGIHFDLHLGRLADELETVWMVIIYTSYGWRPAARILNSVQMRAFLGIRAANFFELNRQLLIPGRLLPSSRYDSETVAHWLFATGYRLFTGQSAG